MTSSILAQQLGLTYTRCIKIEDGEIHATLTERIDAMNAAFQGQAVKGVSFLILDVPDWKALD